MSETIDFDKDLEKLLDQEPFAPFDIIRSGGDRYKVSHPRWVAMGGNMIVVLQPEGGSAFIRKHQIIAVNVREPAQ